MAVKAPIFAGNSGVRRVSTVDVVVTPAINFSFKDSMSWNPAPAADRKMWC